MIKQDEQLTRLNDSSFIVPMAWMRTKLHLTGTHLWAYAIIYGFSQDGESWFYGSRAYIAEWAGVDKTTVSRALKDLTAAGIIERKEVNRDGVICPIYRAKMTHKNAPGVGTMPRGVGMMPRGVGMMPTNNIDNNIDNSLTNTNVLVKGDEVASTPESNSLKTPSGTKSGNSKTYGNENINSMFDFWREKTGQAIISREKLNRRACYNLLRNKRIGEEKLRRAIEFIGETAGDRFAPRVSDFVDLQAKFNALCAYKNRRDQQKPTGDAKTPNRAVLSGMKSNYPSGGIVSFEAWRPSDGDLKRDREWQERERRQTEESAKVDADWLENLKQETYRKINDHGGRK